MSRKETKIELFFILPCGWADLYCVGSRFGRSYWYTEGIYVI